MEIRKPSTRNMAWYALGAGTIAVLRFWGPALAKATRPVAREGIKGGLVLKREMERLTEEARAGLEDLTEEARAELDGSGPASGSTQEP
jgi:hypothetical protein